MKHRLEILAVAGCLLATLSPAAWAEENTPPHRPGREPRYTAEEWTRMEHRADETWKRLPTAEKLQLLRFHRALQAMGEEERAFLHERIERFRGMSDQERRQLHDNRQRWQQMSPEQKERARQEFRRRHPEFEQRWRENRPGQEPPPAGAPHAEPPPQPPTQP